MFDERMSSEQLLAEYYADLPDIQGQTICFDQSSYVSKYLNKHKGQGQVSITGFFTSSQGNCYLGILVYTQEECCQSKEWNFISFHIGLMNSSKGMCAIAFYTQTRQAIKFTSHFFHRYKERFGEICDELTRSQLVLSKSMIDIISIYIKRNLSMVWIETRSVFKDKIHVFSLVNDGVVLLQWNKHKKLLQANTFVTMDMLSKKQAKMMDYARAYISLPMEQRMNFEHPDFISSVIN